MELKESLMDMRDVSKQIGVSVQVCSEMARIGIYKAFKKGHTWYVDKKDFETLKSSLVDNKK